MTPKIAHLRQDDTHRLIPTLYSDQSVLERLASNERGLKELFELDSATNDRLLGEANRLPGITVHELIFGVEYAHIVNASFTHPRPGGSRFNSAERGAWYAAFELDTASTEVAFHKAKELQEINWTETESFAFHDYLADFRFAFHDIRDDTTYTDCLDPTSYERSQRLAAELLASASAGIIYPSVRRNGGTCLVCFRPALVTNVRQRGCVSITFHDAWSSPEVHLRVAI